MTETTTRRWTPGPWRVDVIENRDFPFMVWTHVEPEVRLLAQEPDGYSTREVSAGDGFHMPNRVAAAYLIAAAPDLYEALEELCARAEGSGYYDGEGQRHPVYVDTDAARAALAKARGEKATP